MMATPPASHAHPADFPPVVPQLLHVVLDARDARREAEFWRDAPRAGLPSGRRGPEEATTTRTGWCSPTRTAGGRLAVQEVEQLTASRWPEPGHPSVSHLDTTVPSRSALDAVHDLVLELGGELRLDRTDDPEEPLRAYASPDGHVFCVFVA